MYSEYEKMFEAEALKLAKEILAYADKRDAHHCFHVDEQKMKDFQSLSVLSKVFEKAFNTTHEWRVGVKIYPPNNTSKNGMVCISRVDDTEADIDFSESCCFDVFKKMIAIADGVIFDSEILYDDASDVQSSIMFSVHDILTV